MIVRVQWNLALSPGSQHAAPWRRDTAWYDYRWHLWEKYTQASLLRQTYSDFEVWLHCNKDYAEHTDPMADLLPDKRFKLVYDMDDQIKKTVRRRRTLFVRIDNDDMYGKKALQLYHEANTKKPYIQFVNGWVLNHHTGKLAVWTHPSPAFNCQSGGPDIAELRSKAKMHHQVSAIAHTIKDRGQFMLILHGNNAANDNVPNRAHIGPEVTGAQKMKAFEDYNLKASDYPQKDSELIYEG